MTRTSHRWQSKPGNFDTPHAGYHFRPDNAYGIPALRHTPARCPIGWCPTVSALGPMKPLDDGCVYFFPHDYRFERIWMEPAQQSVGSTGPLPDYQMLLTPDFSLYRDWPLTLQLWKFLPQPCFCLYFSYLDSIKIPLKSLLTGITIDALLSRLGSRHMLLNLDYPILGLLSRFYRFPSRSIERAAFALITTEGDGKRCYLLQWNSKWQCYNFIGGKVAKDGSENDDFAQAIRREIKEEMGIELERLLVAREIKQIRFWQFSERDKRIKRYLFAIFEIHFFPNLPVDQQTITRALRWLSSKHDNIYVSRQEIMNLRTVDGKPISKTVRRILADLGEI